MRSSSSQTTFDRRLFTIMPDGNVNIPFNLKIADNLICNYLFNNTGGNHGDITDFNAVSHFG
jgi:hypothetical protein